MYGCLCVRHQVMFSSLDLMLHTEALLSTMDFLSAALSNSSLPSPERENKKTEDMRTTSAKSSKHTQLHILGDIQLKVHCTL